MSHRMNAGLLTISHNGSYNEILLNLLKRIVRIVNTINTTKKTIVLDGFFLDC
jgi:hypothetical protein